MKITKKWRALSPNQRWLLRIGFVRLLANAVFGGAVYWQLICFELDLEDPLASLRRLCLILVFLVIIILSFDHFTDWLVKRRIGDSKALIRLMFYFGASGIYLATCIYGLYLLIVDKNTVGFIMVIATILIFESIIGPRDMFNLWRTETKPLAD